MNACGDNEHNYNLIGTYEDTSYPLSIYMFCNKCGKVREVVIPEDSNDDWDVNETSE